MTKQNPDKLCDGCQEFDFFMNRKDGISFDVYVVCEHDENDLNADPRIAMPPGHPLIADFHTPCYSFTT